MAEEEQNENIEETPSQDGPAPTGAEESSQETAGAPAAEAAPALSPKERRQRGRAERSARQGARPVRTPEERQAEREAKRAANAKRRRAYRAKQREKAAGAGGEATPPKEHGPGRQKVRQGVVVSDKADKSITVRIDVARRHRRYQKIVRSSTTLHAHDESNDAHIGDTVVVRESRPLSRTKRWRLVEVVERAK